MNASHARPLAFKQKGERARLTRLCSRGARASNFGEQRAEVRDQNSHVRGRDSACTPIGVRLTTRACDHETHELHEREKSRLSLRERSETSLLSLRERFEVTLFSRSEKRLSLPFRAIRVFRGSKKTSRDSHACGSFATTTLQQTFIPLNSYPAHPLMAEGYSADSRLLRRTTCFAT